MTAQDTRLPGRLERSVPGIGNWVRVCAAAEWLGMTAAALAALSADTLLENPSVVHQALAWLAVLVAGTTEALAVGLAQSALLRRRVPALRATRFVVTTMVVAGAFWAAASVPNLTGSSAEDAVNQASPLLIVLGSAALGALAGALLGTAQTLTMRSVLGRPWVWTSANVAGWALVMPIMMLGATAPSAGWPTVATLCWAGLTGLVAGATLGAVLGWFAPSLQGVAPHNRVVLAMLRQGHPRRLAGALLGLRITGRRTGRALGLPVMYAEADGVLWVAVGRSHRKTWWRNVAPQAPVEVLQHGYWHPAVADLVPPAGDRYPGGLALYTRRWPKAGLEPADPLVRIASEERR